MAAAVDVAAALGLRAANGQDGSTLDFDLDRSTLDLDLDLDLDRSTVDLDRSTVDLDLDLDLSTLDLSTFDLSTFDQATSDRRPVDLDRATGAVDCRRARERGRRARPGGRGRAA